MDELTRMERQLDELLTGLSPANRKRLSRKIGTRLRDGVRARIVKQENPDGTAWAARKSGGRRKMMRGLKLARHLKVHASADHVSVGWSDGTARIARVHHYGLRDRVTKRGVRVKYEAREMLGLTEADIDAVDQAVSEILGGL